MIIGEAPGRTEVEQGKPFVGKSGILLDQALMALGVDRSKCYVTNVVKFLPLDSKGKIRPPTPKEMEHGRDKLLLEIKETGYAPILALGKTASGFLELWYCVPTMRMVFPAWHPSYVLRRHGGLSVEWLEQIRPWAERVKQQ
jgi:uracil-DNA glycosylase family 4